MANNYVMDDSLQNIVAASHPLFSSVLLRYRNFTPEDAGRRKDKQQSDIRVFSLQLVVILAKMASLTNKYESRLSYFSEIL